MEEGRWRVRGRQEQDSLLMAQLFFSPKIVQVPLNEALIPRVPQCHNADGLSLYSSMIAQAGLDTYSHTLKKRN